VAAARLRFSTTRRVEAIGAFGKQTIRYCGCGIAASAGAFALVLPGYCQCQALDASLSEWAIDPTLSMETD
jgi:thiosulfate/3-mercaptopyruvate sulfurtransferase